MASQKMAPFHNASTLNQPSGSTSRPVSCAYRATSSPASGKPRSRVTGVSSSGDPGLCRSE